MKLVKKIEKELRKNESEVWMDPPFGSGPRIKVKILKNESKIPDNVEGKLKEVRAYKVEEVGGERRKWSLVPETMLHDQNIDII